MSGSSCRITRETRKTLKADMEAAVNMLHSIAHNYTRTEQQELSFQGERLLRGRHRIHPYPAMLHPLLVDFLIGKYAKTGDRDL